MKKTLKSIIGLTVFLTGIGAVNAQNIHHDFSASIVNHSGHAIKFFADNSAVAIATNTGSASHLLWNSSPTINLRIEGFTTNANYELICPDIQHIVAGQTIRVFTKHTAFDGAAFYCQIFPLDTS